MEYPAKNQQNYLSIDKSILRRYNQYLQLEKSLSPNTLEAYQNDLNHLLEFLQEKNLCYKNVTIEDLQHFCAVLIDLGISARSLARTLSGLRSFYRFLLLEGEVENDPTELLEGPKIARHIPDVLTVEEIDRMISCIDLSKQEAQRNRAILEVLYSCGLRVIEARKISLRRPGGENDGGVEVCGAGHRRHRAGYLCAEFL